MAGPEPTPPAKILRVAAVQFQHAPGDKSANLGVIRSFVEQAAAERVQLICFPECCISGYWHLRHLTREQMLETAEPVFDGPAARFLMDLAQRHQMTVGAGLVELGADGGLYNSYVVAMPDGRFASALRAAHPTVGQPAAQHGASQGGEVDIERGGDAGVALADAELLLEDRGHPVANHPAGERGRIFVSAIGMSLIVPAIFGVGSAGSLAAAVTFLILFGLGWGFFDCNNMPILCQVVRPDLRASGYGVMNLVSISCGGVADWGFGALRDARVPLDVIFGLFAAAALLSVALVLLIRPRYGQ